MEIYFSMIEIATAKGDKEVVGLYVGELAIINDGDGKFNLTHIGTGKRLIGCETLEDALRGARELQEYIDIDWGADFEKLTKGEQIRMAAAVSELRTQGGFFK